LKKLPDVATGEKYVEIAVSQRDERRCMEGHSKSTNHFGGKSKWAIVALTHRISFTFCF
jgi:hypothetical protein